jgi:hypothetical protein
MLKPAARLSRRRAIARMAAALGVLCLPRSLYGQGRDPFPHPEPRAGITGEKVIATADLGTTNRNTIAAYDAARAHPATFDGLYCVCECDKNMGHRSLLGCFESRQAIGCHSCREQAQLVVKMLDKDQTLPEIRKAFDEKWG